MGSYPGIETWAKSRVPSLADADIDREATLLIASVLNLYPCVGATYGAISATDKTFFDAAIGLLIASKLYLVTTGGAGALIKRKEGDVEYTFADLSKGENAPSLTWATEAAGLLGQIACIRAARRVGGNYLFAVSGPTRTAKANGGTQSLLGSLLSLLSDEEAA